MTNGARDILFFGTALSVVFGTFYFSETISKSQLAAAMYRAADFATRKAEHQASRLQMLAVAAAPSEEPLTPEHPIARVSLAQPVEKGVEGRLAAASTLMAPSTLDAAQACDSLAAAPVVFGDRLHLRVYETHPSITQADGARATGIAFERLDLTGVYDVGADGNLSLPLVGRIEAVGQDLACLEATLGAAFEAGFGAPMRISANWESRPPIVLEGDIGAPGRYDAAAGMNVRDLLSAAGDLRVAVPDVRHLASLDGRRIEIEAALADAQIEMARLSALLQGRGELELSSATRAAVLADLGGDRMALEAEALAAQLEERAQHRARVSRDITTQAQQVAEREESLRIISDQLAILDERHASLKTLQARGVVSAKVLSEAEMNRMALQRTLIEARLGMIQARADYEKMLSSNSVAVAEWRSDLLLRLRDASRQVAALSSQLEGIKMQIGLETRTGDHHDNLTVRIERRVPNIGEMIINADLHNDVLPGDLVTVAFGAVASYPREQKPALEVTNVIDVASK